MNNVEDEKTIFINAEESVVPNHKLLYKISDRKSRQVWLAGYGYNYNQKRAIKFYHINNFPTLVKLRDEMTKKFVKLRKVPNYDNISKMAENVVYDYIVKNLITGFQYMPHIYGIGYNNNKDVIYVIVTYLPYDLNQAVYAGKKQLELITGATTALNELALRGYTYNKVTPRDLMVDEAGKVYLTDFKNLTKIGETLTTHVPLELQDTTYLSAYLFAESPRPIPYDDVESLLFVSNELLSLIPFNPQIKNVIGYDYGVNPALFYNHQIAEYLLKIRQEYRSWFTSNPEPLQGFVQGNNIWMQIIASIEPTPVFTGESDIAPSIKALNRDLYRRVKEWNYFQTEEDVLKFVEKVKMYLLYGSTYGVDMVNKKRTEIVYDDNTRALIESFIAHRLV